MKPTVLLVAGTRPEVIKLAPVARALDGARSRIRLVVCLTGQHRELVDDVIPSLGLSVDHDLDVMTRGQDMTQVARKVLNRLPAVLTAERPDLVLVQGDTVSATIAAVAAFYAGVPVGHVEAGLRTGRLDEPFPEEGDRRLIASISSVHFAPTRWAAENLRREGIPDAAIEVTGNTGIDSFRRAAARVTDDVPAPLRRIEAGERPWVLVTVHRRENQSHHLPLICAAVRRVAQDLDAQVVFPLHPSPTVRDVVLEHLSGRPRIALVEPLDHPSMVWLLLQPRCRLVLTDSGGLQEEAATAGVPVLVLRDATDRPEGVQAGCATLVGSATETIVSAARTVLNGGGACPASARELYGDGSAGQRIADRVVRLLCPPGTPSPG